MFLNNHDLAKAYQERLLHDARPEPLTNLEPRGGRLVLAVVGVSAMAMMVTGVVLALLRPVL